VNKVIIAVVGKKSMKSSYSHTGWFIVEVSPSKEVMLVEHI